MGKIQIDLSKAYRFLYPRLTVIVSSGTINTPNALAIAWSTPLSVDPPLLGILISVKRYSHEVIQQTRTFVVNIPHFGLVSGTHLVGQVSGREDAGKIEKAGFSLEKSKEVTAPQIKECPINLECELHDIITTGDHDLFVGKVVAVVAKESILDDWAYDLTKHY
ncbi:MAG: flavin reductase family protein [Candidatus Kariarchaeaceae archaeon]